MLDSLTSDADADYGYVGFGAPYALYHELGTKRMRRRGLLTANPSTGRLGREDERLLLSLLERYLEPRP
jgi:phage gpG-like protein